MLQEEWEVISTEIANKASAEDVSKYYHDIAAQYKVDLETPARVVVGGELAQAGELLIGPLQAALERWALPGAAEGVEVVPARLGARAHVLGSVALAGELVLAAHG